MKKPTIAVFCAHTKIMKISELKKLVHPRNPNKHPRDQIKMLSDILKKNGWRAPITISNRCGLIIRGHGRLEAADFSGCTDAPVDYQDYESEAAEMADMIADNRVQQQSVLDLDACLEIMQDIGMDEIDCGSFGFSAEDLDAYMQLPDMEDMSGHYQKKKPPPEPPIEQPRTEVQQPEVSPGPTQKPRGKLTFKCPKCGHEEV